MFQIRRQIAFYETDMMGVVHHSNYLRFFEDARLAWLTDIGLLSSFKEADQANFAVVEAHSKFKKAAKYGDFIRIEMKVYSEKLKIHFDYAIFNDATNELLVDGFTKHVTVDKDLKVIRIPENIKQLMEKSNG